MENKVLKQFERDFKANLRQFPTDVVAAQTWN